MVTETKRWRDSSPVRTEAAQTLPSRPHRPTGGRETGLRPIKASLIASSMMPKS